MQGSDAVTHSPPPLKRRSLEDLAREETADHGQLPVGPIDQDRLFICPQLTPLYYTPSYAWLSPHQRLRYNQLTAMQFNEQIIVFERAFSPGLERIRELVAGSDPVMARCLRRFIDDERWHIEYWRALNRCCEPDWYRDQDYAITRIKPRTTRWLARLSCTAPNWPAVIWFILAMEERGLHMARLTRGRGESIDPTFREAYRHHSVDEVRHVEMDRHLIERFFATLSPARRRLNAILTARLLHAILVPKRMAVRVLAALVREFPDLEPWQSRMRDELYALRKNPDYVAMMYSRTMTPLLFHLADQYAEMRSAMKTLPSYRPQEAMGA